MLPALCTAAVFSFIGTTVMTPNELRILNLKLDVKTVKALMELYQQQNYGHTTVSELLRLATPKIDDKEEKLGLMKKCAAVRQVWNISELAPKLDVSRQTLYNWKSEGYLLLDSQGKVHLPSTIKLWEDLDWML